MNFISMSKSVSRGLCCAGTIIAGPSQASKDWLHEIKVFGALMDSEAEQSQILALCENHHGVKERNDRAWKNGTIVGEAL